MSQPASMMVQESDNARRWPMARDETMRSDFLYAQDARETTSASMFDCLTPLTRPRARRDAPALGGTTVEWSSYATKHSACQSRASGPLRPEGHHAVGVVISSQKVLAAPVTCDSSSARIFVYCCLPRRRSRLSGPAPFAIMSRQPP